MTSIQDIFTKGMSFRQTLIPKKCMISIPDSVIGNYSGKSFIFDQISASSGISERFKNIDSTYSDDAVEIMILYDIISNTTDRTGSVNAPFSGYKNMNAKIIYNGIKYVIKVEEKNPFDNSMTLICDTKN